MRFDESADLDTSRFDDVRGGGGGGGGLGGRVAAGGGGVSIVGLLIYFLLTQLGGGSISDGLNFPDAGSTGGGSQQVGPGALEQACKSGKNVRGDVACEIVADINSLDAYWSDSFARSGNTLTLPRTEFFSGGVNTGGCGSATSATGPFYCPADSKIYIDLTFFAELENKFGTQGGPFARAYVMAHEYGHHIQNELGTNKQVRGNATGPMSGSVRLELQADCYSGVWGNHATTAPGPSGRPLITEVTDADVKAALDTASRIGDDFIQTQLGGGQVDESQFSHGSSAQREKWYRTGFESGNPAACDTFGRNVNLG